MSTLTDHLDQESWIELFDWGTLSHRGATAGTLGIDSAVWTPQCQNAVAGNSESGNSSVDGIDLGACIDFASQAFDLCELLNDAAEPTGSAFQYTELLEWRVPDGTELWSQSDASRLRVSLGSPCHMNVSYLTPNQATLNGADGHHLCSPKEGLTRLLEPQAEHDLSVLRSDPDLESKSIPSASFGRPMPSVESVSSIKSSPSNHLQPSIGRRSSALRAELTCNYPGCTHRKPFYGRYELKRHILAKHKKSQLFSCPVNGCFKKRNQTSFARADHLSNHIRSVHNDNSTTECPHQECARRSIRLDELAIHLMLFHGEPITPQDRAIVNGLKLCIYWTCREPVTSGMLLEHLELAHRRIDPDTIVGTVMAGLFLWEKDVRVHTPDCLVGHDASVECLCPQTTNIFIVCPVCGRLSGSHRDFRIHMGDFHLIRSEEHTHFEAWRQHFAENNRGQLDANDYGAGFLWAYSGGSRQLLKCPVCGWSSTVGDGAFVAHHRSMYSNLEEVKPFRRQILKLYPAVAVDPCWLPLWDDLARPLHISGQDDSAIAINR